MIGSIREASKSLIDRTAQVLLGRQAVQERTSAATKIALQQLYLHYRERVEANLPLCHPREAGLRIFSQFDEDGIIVFLLGAVGVGTYRFVDIGAGDGVTGSNTANLALNLGFDGAMFDGNFDRVRYGQRFYARHPDTRYLPPRFEQLLVSPTNVDDAIRGAGIEGEIDVLSIDIDGNDYWVWKAIEVVSPRIVVMEAHPSLGAGEHVTPYLGPAELLERQREESVGASPAAMDALATRLGYRRVATNRHGFNLFYLRNDLGRNLL